LRVDEAITLFATSRARPPAELLGQFGLEARRRSAFGSLSGGERQRLFLVLALLNRPRLVILDELTQGLDPAARRDVWAAVEQLRADGTTVLLVTHELDEAEALCDRVVAMRGGRVLDAGAPADLVARHAGWAKVRFSWAGPVEDLRASLLGASGVNYVAVDNAAAGAAQFTVHGERRVIAYVGAELVRHETIPADLRVEVPDLESALIELLEADSEPAAAVPHTTAELIGAQR
jgi:ABC-2 type transport system ATP-binding protein